MAKARQLENGPYVYEQLPLIKALLYGQTTHNQEIVIQKPNQTQIILSANATPLIDEKGSIIGALAIFEDITQRKKTEEALKASEHLYRTLFENTAYGFQLFKVLWDEEGNPIDLLVLKVNKAYETQTGLRASDILGKTVKEFIPSIEPYWISSYGNVAKMGESVHVENYNKSTARWYDVYAFPYAKDEVGALFRDVTDQKRLQKQLNDSERLAAIGATAGMVGHDIRNPLQAIIGDLFLLKDFLKSMPEVPIKRDVSESLEEMEKNVGYINKIVADLQDFSRKLEPECTNVNLHDLVMRVFKPIAIPDNLNPTIEIDSSIQISTDITLFTRILTNLIINAIQAMPNGGKLFIGASQLQDKVIISVKDTGVGIPEEIKPKLFTPMTTTKAKGQGLGLAVVKRLVESLKGNISFESQVGEGTKFIIELPRK